MKRLFVVCILVCALTLEASGRPQDSTEDEDYETDSADIITHPLTFAPVINQTMSEAVSASLELAKFASQCLYDFTGKRTNKDCDTEKPPKCKKGNLVQTMNGEHYEMCCCNESKFL